MCVKILCALCCTCFCLIVGVLVAAAIWVSHLKLPTAGISRIGMSALDLGHLPASIDVEADLWIDNPNGWPFSGDILRARASVYSLTKNDTAPLYIGEAALAKSPLEITTYSNTSFTVQLDGSISSLDLVDRLRADCGEQGVVDWGARGSTRIGLNVTEISVSIWHKDLEITDLGVLLNVTIPCPDKVAPVVVSRIVEAVRPVVV